MAKEFARVYRISCCRKSPGGSSMKYHSMSGAAVLRAVLMVASIAAVTLSLQGVAKAAVGGVVSGTWTFWNMNGNFCPSTNACMGARYPQTQYNAALPISNAYVFVLDNANTVIGQGFTDSNGAFSISWERST